MQLTIAIGTALLVAAGRGARRHVAAAFAPPPPASPAFVRGADALAGRDPAAAAFPSFSGAQVHSGARNAHGLSPVAARPSWDDIDPDANDEDDPDAGEDGIDALAGRKLGIDIGAQLPALSPEELADIKAAAQKTLDAAVDARVKDIEDLRAELREDAAASRERRSAASALNAQLEKQNLMEKIDGLTNDFLYKDKDFREGTRRAAEADARSAGRGVAWGSWGAAGDGSEVVVTGGAEAGGTQLLGSVDAARRRGDAEDGSEGASSVAAADNRVLVVVDDKQDKGAAPILARLTALLNDAFDSNIIVDTYSPSSVIPMGGKNAQAAIIFASSLNDRSSLESLLGRILKRTAPVAGGAVGVPPSHVLIVSRLGTERTNQMPFSMQNLFGGKLDKLREIEQGIAAISKTRAVGKQASLDYTVVKFGDVASDGDGDGSDLAIRPGDTLEGGIGPNAAANVLLQAMAYQPYARNSTLCASGGLPPAAALDAAAWNDKFLCLSGPELLRVEVGRAAADDASFDTQLERLQQFVTQWAASYEGDRKATGLTTPTLVRPSRRPSSRLDGVASRAGVRILFQATNTGDRYKSAAEDRVEDRERSGTTKKPSPPSKSKPVLGKARKDGGVEVLVEKTTDGGVRVRARRCNMDDKTIVKEMSEEVIVKSLKKAVEVWKKAWATVES